MSRAEKITLAVRRTQKNTRVYASHSRCAAPTQLVHAPAM